MLSESFKIVYFAGVLASLLSISTAKCPSSDPACNYKLEGGHLSQPPNYKIINIPNSSGLVGRSLYWDHQTNNLYYVDMKAAEILRYHYGKKKVYKAKVKGEMYAGFIIPVKGKSNLFVVGCGLRVLIVEWDGFSDIATPIDTLFEVGGLLNGTNSDLFTYGKCDGRGRLFAGTYPETFVFDIKKRNFSMEHELSSVNFVWDDRRKKIYYIDAQDFNIKGYPYDLETGTTDFSHQKFVMNLYKTNSNDHIIPYDMTIDREGNLYVVTVYGGQIYVINPDKDKVLYTIKLPCSEVTSVVFGGPNLDILYVTTKGVGKATTCGSVFEITGLGSYGITLNKAVIPIKPNYKIENIPNSRGLMGQSLYWDHQTNNLYYVDMEAGQILRYHYGEEKVYKAKVEGENNPGFIIPVEGKPNQFVVGCGLRVLIVEWDGYSDIANPIDTLFEVGGLQNPTKSYHFIYGKCDGGGRLFAGTYPETFVFDIKKSHLPTNYERLSMNVVWDDKRQKVYYIDAQDFNIKGYPYDLETGIADFSHQKFVMNLYKTNNSEGHIYAHDMTIDREGNFYVATVYGGQIYVINPDKDEVLYTIKLPCAHATSVVFGGPNLDILYVTTAKGDGKPTTCGSVFKITGLRSYGYKSNEAVITTKPNYKIKNIPNSSGLVGRSLYWDHQTNNLYYVDMKAGQILRYNYEEKKVYKAKVNGEVYADFIIPVKDKSNLFVVGCAPRVLIVEWDGYSDIATPIDTLFKSRNKYSTMEEMFYYGKCDQRGRLFVGTIYKSLLFDIKESHLRTNYEGFSMNVVWDDERQKVYYIDEDFNIKRYPYDLETGIADFSHQKFVSNLYKTNSSEEHIYARDMTIDRAGNLYVATVYGGQIYVINPDKDKVLYTIKLPCAHVTSAVFGGPNLDILYVTTAKSDGHPPPCGSVFEITGLGSYGIPLNKAVIPIKPNYKIENIPNSSGLVGQSLYWDHQTNNLYYVDMNAGQILRYHYGEEKVYKAKVEGENNPGFIIPVEGKPNQFVVGCGVRVLIVEWDGYSDIATPIDTLFEVGGLQNGTNSDLFTYGKCDARGHLLAGTLTKTFVFDIKKRNFSMEYELSSRNFVWDDRRKKIYYIDAQDFNIKGYPYDLETGIADFSHQKFVSNLYKTNSSEEHIYARDMTIDRAGNLYVATVYGGQIYVINPDKDKVLYTIKLPCAHVTSAVFGGPNLDILYVATKGVGKATTCGSVFEITGLGSYGITLNKAVIPIKPNYKIKEIPNSIASAGQSPYWDHQHQNLYYVDNISGEILRYHYGEEKVYKAKVKGQMYASFIIPVKDKSNLFVVGCAPRVLIVEWDGYSDIATPVDTLFNLRLKHRSIEEMIYYGKCDQRGRLFVGTFYKSLLFDIKESHLRTNYEGFSMNVVWDDKRQKVYYIDGASNIKGYPYDLETGIADFSHQKFVSNLYKTNSSEEHIYARDMTIDRAGNLYVAPFNDDRIHVINPDKDEVLYTIKLPCAHATSVVFGGPHLDVLFVTFAESNGKPTCGSVFKITGLGSYGYKSNKAVIPIKVSSSNYNKQDVLPSNDGRKNQKNGQPNYELEEIPNSSTSWGQSPYWDHQTNNLYYVDVNAGQILRYDYFKKKVYKAKVEGEKLPGFIIPVEGKPNQFVVSCGLRVLIVEWDGYSDIATPIDTLFKNGRLRNGTNSDRFIYGKCDGRGRLFAVTYPETFVFDIKKRNFAIEYELISRNFVWDDRRKKIYYIDALDSNIKGYPYDLETGIEDFGNQKVVMDFRRTNSSEYIKPFDMTIDNVGNLYVAAVNDDRIHVINPEMGQNKVLYTIKLPCTHVTSAVFGGPNLDILYVTTAKGDGKPTTCGSVFEITGLGSYGFISSKAVTKRTQPLIR